MAKDQAYSAEDHDVCVNAYNVVVVMEIPKQAIKGINSTKRIKTNKLNIHTIYNKELRMLTE